jgi:hypothetical protein
MTYRLLNNGVIEGFHTYRADLPEPPVIKRSASEIEEGDFEQDYSLRKSSRLAEFRERSFSECKHGLFAIWEQDTEQISCWSHHR